MTCHYPRECERGTGLTLDFCAFLPKLLSMMARLKRLLVRLSTTLSLSHSHSHSHSHSLG